VSNNLLALLELIFIAGNFAVELLTIILRNISNSRNTEEYFHFSIFHVSLDIIY